MGDQGRSSFRGRHRHHSPKGAAFPPREWHPFIRPGGILLIDEPDLHIHLSMVSQFMETLEVIAGRRNAQMIVASHSEWVWERFSRDAERIELSPWRGGSE
jgi:hypothetical protein